MDSGDLLSYALLGQIINQYKFEMHFGRIHLGLDLINKGNLGIPLPVSLK